MLISIDSIVVGIRVVITNQFIVMCDSSVVRTHDGLLSVVLNFKSFEGGTKPEYQIHSRSSFTMLHAPVCLYVFACVCYSVVDLHRWNYHIFSMTFDISLSSITRIRSAEIRKLRSNQSERGRNDVEYEFKIHNNRLLWTRTFPSYAEESVPFLWFNLLSIQTMHNVFLHHFRFTFTTEPYYSFSVDWDWGKNC